jgi:hypothetical protein
LCADLVVATTVAAERRRGEGPMYVRKLDPRFERHPATGELEGVGLKRFPDVGSHEHGRHRLFAPDGTA